MSQTRGTKPYGSSDRQFEEESLCPECGGMGIYHFPECSELKKGDGVSNMANTDKKEAMQDFINKKTSVNKGDVGRVNVGVHIYGMPRAALKDLVNHVIISGEYGNFVDLDITEV